MPLTDAQKQKLKEMPDEDRDEMFAVLGLKPAKGDNEDLTATVEKLQEQVAKLQKALTRKPNEERRKSGSTKWSWQEFFGV